MSDYEPATREDLDVVYDWRNGGESTPAPYTQKVDAAMSRVLDSAELKLSDVWNDDLEAIPDYPVEVLLYHREGFMSVDVGGSGAFDHGDNELCPITHWMPLPSAPGKSAITKGNEK